MKRKSWCEECRHCIDIAPKITVDPYDSDPGEIYCEEDSENFFTPDGCRYFEYVPDEEY